MKRLQASLIRCCFVSSFGIADAYVLCVTTSAFLASGDKLCKTSLVIFTDMRLGFFFRKKKKCIVIVADGIELPAASRLSRKRWSFLVDSSDLADGSSLLLALGVDLCAQSRVFVLSSDCQAWLPLEETSPIPTVDDEVHVFRQKIGVDDYLASFWERARQLGLSELKGYVEFKEWSALSKMNVHIPRRKGLYIRECFDDFYKSVIAAAVKHPFVHVTGTPGLGKTAFMWYVVLRVAISGAYDLVVQNTWTCQVLVFRRDGSVGIYPSFPTFGSLKLPDPDKVLQLVNGKYIGNHLKSVIIFADRKLKNTSLVKTGGGGSCCRKILPSWTGYEAEFFELCKAEGHVDKDEIHSAVETWGLLPGAILDWNPGTVTKEMITLWAKHHDLAFLHASCNFLELVPIDESYENGRLRFASRHMAELFFKVYWEHRRDDLVVFLETGVQTPEYAELRGFLFRMFLLCSLEQDHLPAIQGCCWSSREFRDFDDLEEIQRDDVAKYVWKPRKCNPAYDAIALPWILRFTVAEDDPKQEELLVVARQLKAWTSAERLNYLVVTPLPPVFTRLAPVASSAAAPSQDLNAGTIACYRAAFDFQKSSLVSKQFTGELEL